jgi:predicted MPP superfamily phosphohydrolase
MAGPRFSRALALLTACWAIAACAVGEPRTVVERELSVASAAPEGADVRGLAHAPDAFEDAPGRVALVVAGHTHCGQINLPIVGPYAISPGARRWPCGSYEEGGRSLYVTGGVTVLPLRVRAPPEIVVITLTGSARGR